MFPAVHPISPELLRQLGAIGQAAGPPAGRGSDLYNLRGYRSGDDPRLIHWRSSAKTQTLTVRELEAETTEDTRLDPRSARGRRAARRSRPRCPRPRRWRRI